MKQPTKKFIKKFKQEIVLDVFKSVDKKIADELLRLKKKKITSTCKSGCCYCCRQLINVPLPEIDVMAQYIKDNFDMEEIDNLRKRTIEWFKWVDMKLPEYLRKGIDQQEAFYNHGPFCPLLLEDKCSVYPVRPLVCRGYYVSSDPRSCMPTNDLLALKDGPTILRSIPSVGREDGFRIVVLIESAGIKFEDAVLPLPFLLQLEMKWKIKRRKTATN